MTLQYRSRSTLDDQVWQERVDACERFLTEVRNQWALSGASFPTALLVAGILYLFSPRCDPFAVARHGVRDQLMGLLMSAEEEYRHTWPVRDDSLCRLLIATLSSRILQAVASWSDGKSGPTAEGVTGQLVTEIVAQQYVVFHHYRTTRRDKGGAI